MSKASNRGFGFTTLAVAVLLLALSAFLTRAEAFSWVY
jgi:hypothetical protein